MEPCVPCHATTVHLDMRRSVCSNLTHEALASWVRRAHGEKATFFRLLQAGTAPFNLTAGKTLAASRSGLGSMIIENLSRQYGGEIRKWKNEAGGMSIHILLPRLQIVDGEKSSEDRG